jgi:hypothetical protein
MPHIRLMGLIDLPALGQLNDRDREAYAHRGCAGHSKSGLDWTPEPDAVDGSELATDRAGEIQAEDTEITEPIVEGMYEGDEGVDNRPLKSYIMSIHKQASELYNILDDTEDPEEWVMEKIKSATASMNAVHGHIAYAKDKVESLEGTPGEKPQERGY